MHITTPPSIELGLQIYDYICDPGKEKTARRFACISGNPATGKSTLMYQIVRKSLASEQPRKITVMPINCEILNFNLQPIQALKEYLTLPGQNECLPYCIQHGYPLAFDHAEVASRVLGIKTAFQWFQGLITSLCREKVNRLLICCNDRILSGGIEAIIANFCKQEMMRVQLIEFDINGPGATEALQRIKSYLVEKNLRLLDLLPFMDQESIDHEIQRVTHQLIRTCSALNLCETNAIHQTYIPQHGFAAFQEKRDK